MKETDNYYNEEPIRNKVPNDGIEEIEIEPININDM